MSADKSASSSSDSPPEEVEDKKSLSKSAAEKTPSEQDKSPDGMEHGASSEESPSMDSQVSTAPVAQEELLTRLTMLELDTKALHASILEKLASLTSEISEIRSQLTGKREEATPLSEDLTETAKSEKRKVQAVSIGQKGGAREVDDGTHRGLKHLQRTLNKGKSDSKTVTMSVGGADRKDFGRDEPETDDTEAFVEFPQLPDESEDDIDTIPLEIDRTSTPAKSARITTGTGIHARDVKEMLKRKVKQMEQWETGTTPLEKMRTRSIAISQSALTPNDEGEFIRTSSLVMDDGEGNIGAEPFDLDDGKENKRLSVEDSTDTEPIMKQLMEEDETATAANVVEARSPELPAPKPQAPEPDSGPDVPYPEVVSETKRLMFDIKHGVKDLLSEQTMPGTGTEIPAELRNDLIWYSRLLLEDFLNTHTRLKGEARNRFKSLTAFDPSLSDPSLFWDDESLNAYEEYRTTLLIENLLDHLEKEILAEDVMDCADILDMISKLAGLERIQVVPGQTTFDPDLHEGADLRLTGADEAAFSGQKICRVILSGYRDHRNGELIRKAQIRTTEHTETFDFDEEYDEEFPALPPADDELDTQPLIRQLQNFSSMGESEPKKSIAINPQPGPEPDEEAVKEAAESQVPIPPVVESVEKMIQTFKSSLSDLVHTERLPKSDLPLNAEIRDLMLDLSNGYLRSWAALHKNGKEKAQVRFAAMASEPVDVRDPNAYWSAEMQVRYQDYRTKVFIEAFLDKLEARIASRRLKDHIELLDHLAATLQLARIRIESGETLYNTEFHELASAGLPPNADLSSMPVLTVVKSGYLDTTSQDVVRRALVTIRLRAFRSSASSN